MQKNQKPQKKAQCYQSNKNKHMQVKTKIRYCYTSSRMTKVFFFFLTWQYHVLNDKDTEQMKISYIPGRNKKLYSHSKSQFGNLLWSQTHLLYDLAIILQGAYTN